MNEVHTLLFSSRVASVYYNTNEIQCRQYIVTTLVIVIVQLSKITLGLLKKVLILVN